MYLYETYHDPIQMISGDAYADIGKVKPRSLDKPQSPIHKHKKSQKIELEKAIKQYLLTDGVKHIAQRLGIHPTDVRYRAKKMGYRTWGSKKGGHWEAPKEEGN